MVYETLESKFYLFKDSIKNSKYIHINLNRVKYFLSLAVIYSFIMFLHYNALKPVDFYSSVIFVIMLFTNLPLSYMTLQIILSLYYGRKDIHYDRKKLVNYPKTAVILGVYNDLIPDYLLKTMKNNQGLDYWLLSDSNPENMEKEAKFCKLYNINYFHRGDRRGKKAGAINDWAEEHLWKYEYYVTLDKDSILKRNNVKDLLEIAEHPSNSTYAVFQTRIISLPGNSVFSILKSKVANVYLAQYPRNDAISLGTTNYWGHNALLRSEAYYDVGGQDEYHLNEDISYTMKLREKGWNVAYISNVISYEEQPGDLASEWDRLARWMRGSYESTYLALSKVSKIGVASMWTSALAGLIYMSSALLFLNILITALYPVLWGGIQFNYASSVISRFLLSGHMLGTLFLGPVLPFIRKRGTWKTVFLIFLNTIISMPGVLRLTYESVKFFFIRNSSWNPTRQESGRFTLKQSIEYTIYEFSFGIFLIMLIRLFGSFSTFLQLSPWILSFLASPIVLYLTSKSGIKNSLMKAIMNI